MATCNICGGQQFGTGPGGRRSCTDQPPKCLSCNSLERHRSLWQTYTALAEKIFFHEMSAIHFSRDSSIDRKWFHSYERSLYGINNSINIMDIDRADMSYDIVVCNHVLEHLSDDIIALRELMRITSGKGFLQFSVPGSCSLNKTRDWGFPDKTKHGHYRQYGMDFEKKLYEALPYNVYWLIAVQADPVTRAKCLFFFVTRSKKIITIIRLQLKTVSTIFNDCLKWGVGSWAGAT